MPSSILDRRILPSFWLPVMAGLPLGICLLLMAVPIMGYGSATISRALYLFAFVLWIFPLTFLQRWLWLRRVPLWGMALILLLLTYAMALASRLISLALQGMLSTVVFAGHDGSNIFRGLEGAWLVLVAYCAVHAVVAHYAELQQERADHGEARALARDAELLALRYQLQPHFLFNTLNAVSSLVAEGRTQDAQRMIARLGDFLRTVLEARGGHEVALAEEVAMTESYLEIEKVRMGDRLRLAWQIGPNLLGASVPCLLLQPLVENAVRHGISRCLKPGRLEIAIEAHDDTLSIRVINDAPEAAAIMPLDETMEIGVGLGNVRNRLARLYGDRGRLQAGRRDDARYEALVMLPLLRPSEAQK